jgi:hypothetical protein
MGPVPGGRCFLATNKDPSEPTSKVLHRSPLPLGSEKEGIGPAPGLALLLAILVGLVVFTIVWRIRKTFGMKE